MNEIITQNNNNYEDIFRTLESIDFTTNSMLKNILTKFSINITNIASKRRMIPLITRFIYILLL